MTGRIGVPGGLELGMLGMVLCAPHPGSSQDMQQTSCSDISVLSSVEVLLSCATTGDELAQFSLGLMYDSGLGVPEDDVEAVRWYRLAAEQGDAGAQNNLGFQYAKGYGVPEDDAEAVRWYRSAAEQGDAMAQYNLGLHYANGYGVSEDDVEAVRWFGLAAE